MPHCLANLHARLAERVQKRAEVGIISEDGFAIIVTAHQVIDGF